MSKWHLPKFSGEKRIRFAIALFVVILTAAALLRFVEWVKPETQAPLLTETSDMIRLIRLDEISRYVQTPVSVPKKLFGSALHIIGVYPTATSAFPKDTVALVYVKSGDRFMEISYRPNTTLEKEISAYANLPQESVALSEMAKATLIHLREQSFCKKPSQEVIGICQFTRALVFEYQGAVVVMLADGRHATDGEIIEMARSVVLPQT